MNLTSSAVCGVISAVTAAIAAFYWWKSSTVQIPNELNGISGWGGPTVVDTQPLVDAAAESGRLNSKAAKWSAIAAFFAGLSSICGLPTSS